MKSFLPMYRLRLASSLILLSCACMPFAASAQDLAVPDDRYAIAVDLDSGTIDVEADLYHLKNDDTFCLPSFGQRYGESLLDIQISSGNDRKSSVKPVPASHKSGDNTGCYTGVSSSLYIKYKIRIENLHDDRFWIASSLSATRQNQYISIPGESLFIEIQQKTPSPFHTHIQFRYQGQIISTLRSQNLPNNAEIVIRNRPGEPLAASDDQTVRTQHFTSNDPFELTRSYWMTGHFKLSAAMSDQISWQIAWDPSQFPNAPTIQRETSQILDYYASLLPQKTPNRLAVFLYNAPFDADFHHGFARPGGIILQMGKHSAAQGNIRRILIAHELFHQYNGEGLRFNPKKYDETSWFREGMTQYVAFKALLSLGMITRQQFYDWIASSIQKQTAAYDAYHHGFFLSLAIEQQWTLHRTGYTLEKFWQHLAGSNAWHALHDNQSIQNELMMYSAFDFSQFFIKYVAPKSRPPVEDLLRISGLCKYSVQIADHSIGLDYEFDPKSARLIVKSVVHKGPASLAGLKKNDVIAPEPNTNWNDDAAKKLTVLRGKTQISLKIPPVTEIHSRLAISTCR